MKIIAFVGQKGGVGKSTLARMLAVASTRRGHRVLLGDFDLDQLSCIEWSAARLRNGIEPDIDTRAFKSIKQLKKVTDTFDLMVIDTRGLADDFTADISRESDIVFIPTGTSMDDLRPSLALARKLSKSKKISNKIVLVLSKVGKSERLLEIARLMVAEAGFETLEHVWPEKDGFQSDLDIGKAGSESSNPYLRTTATAIENEMISIVWPLN